MRVLPVPAGLAGDRGRENTHFGSKIIFEINKFLDITHPVDAGAGTGGAAAWHHILYNNKNSILDNFNVLK